MNLSRSGKRGNYIWMTREKCVLAGWLDSWSGGTNQMGEEELFFFSCFGLFFGVPRGIERTGSATWTVGRIERGEEVVIGGRGRKRGDWWRLTVGKESGEGVWESGRYGKERCGEGGRTLGEGEREGAEKKWAKYGMGGDGEKWCWYSYWMLWFERFGVWWSRFSKERRKE